MPTVPASGYPYSPDSTVTPSTGGGGFQNIAVSPDSFGLQSSEALGRIGAAFKEASTNFDRMQDRHDAIVADDFTNKYQELETKLLYGDPNVPGDTGFYGKKGEDAMRAMPEIRNQLLAARNGMRASLQTPHQQLLFDQETRRLQAVTLANVGRHYVAESNTYAGAVAKAGVDNGMTRAAQGIAAGDDAQWEEGVGQAMRSGLKMLETQGLANNPEAVNSTLQKIRGDAIKIKAEGIAEKNPLAAVEFVKNNIDGLHGDEANQLLQRYRARATALQADVDNGFAAPPPKMGQTDIYDGSHLPKGASAGILGKYAVGNAEVGAPSGVENVHPVFAQRIDRMVQAMPPNIREKFAIESGFRSKERNAEVYAARGQTPTDSYHSYGMAVDTTKDPDVVNWIHENGPKFGVAYTLWGQPGEENHLEPIEGGQRVPAEQRTAWAKANTQPSNLVPAPDRVENWEVRHNNFGGIRKAGVVAGPNAGGFEEYATPQAGVGAIVQKLYRWSTEGVATAMNPTGGPLQSLRQIINVWAPPNENDTAALIDRAVKLTGFGPDDRLDLKDPEIMAKVVEAVIRNEHGGKLPVSPTIIANEAGQVVGFENFKGELQNRPEVTFVGRPPQTFSPTGQPLVRLASNDPDQLIQPVKPLPRLDRALPPLEQGELPDNQLPGMADQLERLMKVIPPDEVERFNAGVKRARQVLNMQYQDQQRQFRLHKEQTDAINEAVSRSYIDRMYGPNPPTAQEIAQDKRLKGTTAENLIRFMERPEKSDPSPQVSTSNKLDIFRRMQPSYQKEDKITSEEPINDAYGKQLLNSKDHGELIKEFRDRRTAEGETIAKFMDERIKGFRRYVRDPMADALKEVDPSGAMANDEREMQFSDALKELVTKYHRDGKPLSDLSKRKNPDDPLSSPIGELAQQFKPPADQAVKTLTPNQTKTPTAPPAEPVSPAGRTPSQIKALRFLGKLTDEEAIKELKQIPGWTD